MTHPVTVQDADPLAHSLQQARGGSVEALGRLLQGCRNYLLTVARQELRAPLQAKMDAADVVQETFIEATRDFASFRGETPQQLLGWLRGILRHNLSDLARRFEAHCRCQAQEVRLFDPFAGTRGCRVALVAGKTICEQLILQEQRGALDAALLRLPASYRQVLHLRYAERRSFADIGSHLHRSPEAARKLCGRAMRCLRQEMPIERET